MELHSPSELVVLLTYECHECCLELELFFLRESSTAKSLSKYSLNLLCCSRLVHNILKSMVRSAAAH